MRKKRRKERKTQSFDLRFCCNKKKPPLSFSCKIKCNNQ